MEEIDVRGQQCPDPLKAVAVKLANAPEGATFKILTDDYLCYMMLRRLIALNELKITGQEEGAIYVLYVQK